MTTQTWPLEASGYEFIHVVGKGSFSNVFHAKCVENNQPVAIKIMDLENVSTSFEDILQEVQTMKLSDHANILRCYCSFVESNQLWLVMQFMNLGSCLRVMNIFSSLGKGDGFNEDWIAYILHETLQGLHYLHANGQIHRDIKSGNILMDSYGHVRVADFGVSGWTVARGLRQESVKTFVGTPCYMAPEVMEQLQGYDSRADIWSIGITCLELAKGYAPYAHHAPMRVLVLTIEEDPPSLKCYPNNLQRTGVAFSNTFEEFYKKCLQKNPKNRPNAEELLRHKFLKNRTKIKEEMIEHLLKYIKPVGSDIREERPRLPGESSVAVTVEKWNYDSSMDSIGKVNRGGGQSHPNDTNNNKLTELKKGGSGKYVKGTTWVFDAEDIDELKHSIHDDVTINRNSNRIDRTELIARKLSISGKSTHGGRDSEGNNNDGNTSDIYKITVQGVSSSSYSMTPPTYTAATTTTTTTTNAKVSEHSLHINPNMIQQPTGITTQKIVKPAEIEVDDFLSDFEKEIVLSEIDIALQPSPTHRIQNNNTPTMSQSIDVSKSSAAPSITNITTTSTNIIDPTTTTTTAVSKTMPKTELTHQSSNSTESFMDELEDIVDDKL